MANEVIKTAAKNAGVKLWEVADTLGVSDCTFSRQLRKEVTEERKQAILSAIKTIVQARQKGEQNHAGVSDDRQSL